MQNQPDNPAKQSQFEGEQGMAIFYSCSPGESALEIEEIQQGTFTYALLETLKEREVARVLTVERLGERLRKRVSEINSQYHREYRQTPYTTVEPVSVARQILQFGLQTFSFETVTVNRRGEIIRRETKAARYFAQELGNNVALEMVAIPGGKFTMGAPEGEKDSRDSERPRREVTVQPFFMGKMPITQAQWRAIAARTELKVKRDLDPDPANFKGDDRPVECVSWYDAVEFCARLSRLTGRDYRLPSEAEWEYACRAGTTTPFYFGETLTDKLANYNASVTYAEEPQGKYREQTTPVGSFPPNTFGLYDMHGNVWEWCEDDWHSNYEGAPDDSRAWLDRNNFQQAGSKVTANAKTRVSDALTLDSTDDNNSQLRKVLRGGSWSDIPQNCRSAIRVNNNFPDYRSFVNGFRVVYVAPRTL